MAASLRLGLHASQLAECDHCLSDNVADIAWTPTMGFGVIRGGGFLAPLPARITIESRRWLDSGVHRIQALQLEDGGLDTEGGLRVYLHVSQLFRLRNYLHRV